MKASKFIVLAGGVLGIVSFFLPLVSVDHDGVRGTASAFDVVSKAAQFEELANIKTFVYAIYVPAVVLALLGGLGVARQRFGRGAGVLSLLVGLAGLGIAALLKGAAEGDGGIGLTFLLVTGIAGSVGGILAIAKPERSATPPIAAMPRLAA